MEQNGNCHDTPFWHVFPKMIPTHGQEERTMKWFQEERTPRQFQRGKKRIRRQHLLHNSASVQRAIVTILISIFILKIHVGI